MFETTSEFRVRYAETDQMGVVYHANYLIWCEVGRTDLLRELGASYADLEEAGIYLAVSDARVRFHAAARYDDRVRVRTRLERVRSRVVRFSYLVERVTGNKVLAKAQTDLVCLDRSGSPRKLPPEIFATLQTAIGSGSGTGTTRELGGVFKERSAQR